MEANERTGLLRPSAPIRRRAASDRLSDKVRWGQEERSGSAGKGLGEGREPRDIEETDVLSRIFIGGRS